MSPEAIRDGLTRQIESPVRWEQSVRAVRAAGAAEALEVGPGKVLQGIVRAIDKGFPVTSIGTLEALDKPEGRPL